MKIWGITATIGNLDEAMEVLFLIHIKKTKITAKEHKKIDILPFFLMKLKFCLGQDILDKN
jgi:ATP-dependent Lhr-like helicase